MVKKPKPRINSETLVAYSAILIAVVTAIVAVYDANINRKYQSISIWPHVVHNTTTNFGTPAKFELLLENKGLGPAVIKDYSISVDGKKVASWQEAFSILSEGKFDFYQALNNAKASQTTIFRDHTILPNEEVNVASVFDPDFVPLFGTEIKRITIETCYCSLYGECWKVTGFDKPAVEMDACPVQEEKDFPK